jgi:hypothetical protein
MSSEVRGRSSGAARTPHSASEDQPFGNQGFAPIHYPAFQNPEIWIIAEVKSLKKQQIVNSADNRNLASSCHLSDIDHSRILITIKLQVNS